MDKLQITITLSGESAPDLLAYLRQIPDARERAFVFRLLAQRGLRALGNAGTDGLLPTPAAMPTTVAPSPVTTDETFRGARANEHSALAAAMPEPTNTSIAAQQTSASTMDARDPLANLDVGALNDAMGRFI